MRRSGRHRRRVALGVLAIASTVQGCSNALLFYETGKISLTLEARPDDSQPVQGNLGYKQRTIVVTPRREDDGDAPAMISSFRFGKEPGFTGAIEIQTAMVTGDAASAAVRQNTTDVVAAAIVANPIPGKVDLARAGLDGAATRGEQSRIQALVVGRSYDQLSDAEKSELARLLRVGSRSVDYDPDLHAAVRAALGDLP